MSEEKKDSKMLLADAIKKRDELNTFIKVLQEMIGAEPVSLITSDSTQPTEAAKVQLEISDPSTVLYPGMFFGKSQPQAVKLLLEKVRRPLKTRTVIECLDKGGMKIGGKKPTVNLWGVLNRNQDTFILVPKAGWGLVEWYDAAVIAKYRKEDVKESDETNDAEKENGKS